MQSVLVSQFKLNCPNFYLQFIFCLILEIYIFIQCHLRSTTISLGWRAEKSIAAPQVQFCHVYRCTFPHIANYPESLLFDNKSNFFSFLFWRHKESCSWLARFRPWALDKPSDSDSSPWRPLRIWLSLDHFGSLFTSLKRVTLVHL